MKALALFSGGLDSMLACAIIAQQGIAVEALFIQTGFGSPNEELLRSRASQALAQLRVVDIRDKYMQNVLFNPKYGFGKAINPCIDCHGYMFATALAMLGELGADFVISGEVLGQRPMSQRAQALASVKKLAGDGAELIVRPLSAKLLAPSLPEQNGWVDREKLLGISGRSRSAQIALAKEFGFSDYESPAGGCILTLAAFKNKVLDAQKYGEFSDHFEGAILQCGRHLRLKNGAKLIISRNEAEGEKLLECAANLPWLKQLDLGENARGALSFLGSKNELLQEDLNLAVSLAKSYASGFCERVRWGDMSSDEPACDKALAQKFFV